MEVSIAVFDLAEAGGVERDAVRVARALIDRGHLVRLISTSAGPLADGIPITILPARGLTNHGRMAAFANDLEGAVDRRKQLIVGVQKLTGLDVLYCGDWCFAERQVLQLLPRYRVMRQLEEACFGPQSNTVLLMLSQPQADAYRRAWSITPERMTVLPPTLDSRRILASPSESDRLELRRSLGIKEGQSAWLWIGLQPKVKGLDRAIAALSLVPDALLVVAGVDPRQKQARRMLEEAEKRGCRDRILPVGKADSAMLDRLFGAGDLLVHPARLDVTGTVIVEALGAGMPVVTTANCGYAVHVSVSGAGIVLSPNASASMIAKAAVVAKDERTSLSKLAHEYVATTELTAGIDLAATRIDELVRRISPAPPALPLAPGQSLPSIRKLSQHFTGIDMRTIERPKCVVCGSAGKVLYRGLVDRLFSSPGEWSISQCANDGCATLWIDPAPLPDDLGQAYLDYFTHERHGVPRLSRAKRAYLESVYGPKTQQNLGDRLLSWIFAFRYRRKLEADDQICHIDIGSLGLKVLDIGCGDGRTLWTLKQLGCDVTGVEFDGAAAATARELGLDVRLGSLQEQGFAAATFDAVVMSHVIEHLPDPKATLQECLRILKPGGQLRMLTPNAAAWGHGHFGRDWMALDPPRHLNIFTPSSMINLLRGANFSNPVVETTPSGADRIAVMSRRIRKTGRGGIREPFGWLEKRYGRAMLQVVRLVNASGRALGSQLVVKARKPLA